MWGRRASWIAGVMVLNHLVACTGYQASAGPSTVPSVEQPSPAQWPTESQPSPTATWALAESPAPTQVAALNREPTACPTLTGTPVPFAVPPIMVVEAGRFLMGSVNGHADGQPLHSVWVSQSFLMAATEVTWELCDRFGAETGRT